MKELMTMMRVACVIWAIAPLCAGWCTTEGIAARDNFRTLGESRRLAAEGQSPQQGQAGGANAQLTLGPIQPVASRPATCPDPTSLELFKHELAYERTEEYDPLKGLREIHVNVWQAGPVTAFYVREPLTGAIPTIRMAYSVENQEIQGSYTCPVEEDWRDCVKQEWKLQALEYIPEICTTVVDRRAIPPWKPSPNDEKKRRIAAELRQEIEAKWPGVQEIVVRDFNLKDNQITMHLKMPDGDYYQGCGFQAMKEPHCVSWHLFGQAPVASIRKLIFGAPYRIK